MNVNSLSFDAYIDQNNVSGIRNLNLETDKSRIILNEVRAEDFNPLKTK